jgi:tetratricopeptide (TPR) repeat protein
MTIRAGARTELCLALDEGWERLVRGHDPVAERAPEDKWVMAAVCAARAQIFAHLDRPTEALALLAQAIPAIERAPGWAANYILTACNAASALWRLGRQGHIATLERNIREKVVAPDFRHPMIDGRLSLARLCVLQERYDEAIEWFARARSVLEEQGARPLLAIAEFDQGITFSRRGGLRDREEAGQHLHAAIEEFHALGMTGWLRRAEGAMRGRGTSPSPARDKRTTSAGSSNTFRLDGDYWTILYEGQALRIKDAKGLRDLAFLLANPGKEIHVTDLIAASGNTEPDPRAGAYERMGREQLAAIGLEASRGERSETALDAEARSAYRARLAELKEDLAEAERCNDTGRATKARVELEFITAELASAYGLGGRSRKPGGDPLERARKAIGFRIRESVSRIHRAHRALGLHLRTSVKTGTFCSYAPHEPTPWDVAFQRRPSNR